MEVRTVELSRDTLTLDQLIHMEGRVVRSQEFRSDIFLVLDDGLAGLMDGTFFSWSFVEDELEDENSVSVFKDLYEVKAILEVGE